MDFKKDSLFSLFWKMGIVVSTTPIANSFLIDILLYFVLGKNDFQLINTYFEGFYMYFPVGFLLGIVAAVILRAVAKFLPANK